MQINFLMQNSHIDIVGSNVVVFYEHSTSAGACKIFSYPTLDGLIKFNMLFSCCLAHPSIVIRASSQLMSCLTYATDHAESKAFEDYELWLRLIHSESPP